MADDFPTGLREVALTVEPFVQRIVAGGLALVAGLWVFVILDPAAGPWLLGPLLVFGGGASLLSGIARPLEY